MIYYVPLTLEQRSGSQGLAKNLSPRFIQTTSTWLSTWQPHSKDHQIEWSKNKKILHKRGWRSGVHSEASCGSVRGADQQAGQGDVEA
jgi:hypothetical protein